MLFLNNPYTFLSFTVHGNSVQVVFLPREVNDKNTLSIGQ
ncbi:hypothetical protein TREPR_3801 [Treponema primitia ZAS-2]|uniref:Uncharacterized protein n=1 Tax=Treponema primitia (strain ATCC BAA-887 / DSM 12427 / ZAS-2) TaxID=545694 RepID=F5YPP1_TREPZ|nr:hypothetical protein TREPR_3801 [Treponema primitia ZAS-2]